MQKLAEVCIRRPIFAVMLIMALVVVGGVSYTKLGIDLAAQDIRDAVATVISQLPKETKPPLIKKLDTDASPVVSLVLAGSKTPRELFEIADRDVRDAIESVSVVGLVQALGGQKRAINVWVDANRLAAYK